MAKMIREKTIFALKGASNTGKTKTIRKVYWLLKNAYPDADIKWIEPKEEPTKQYRGDIYLRMRINETWLGFASEGDPRCDLSYNLEKLASQSPRCRIILCAMRTRGETFQAVEEIGERYGYSIRKIKKQRDALNKKCTEQENKKYQNQMNGKCARSIFKQIKALLSGEDISE